MIYPVDSVIQPLNNWALLSFFYANGQLNQRAPRKVLRFNLFPLNNLRVQYQVIFFSNASKLFGPISDTSNSQCILKTRALPILKPSHSFSFLNFKTCGRISLFKWMDRSFTNSFWSRLRKEAQGRVEERGGRSSKSCLITLLTLTVLAKAAWTKEHLAGKMVPCNPFL